MSWSLQIQNGDFTLFGSRLGTVTDGAKLLQDLRCVSAERMGTDDMHPEYGSLIDGGRMPDGTEVPSPIGITQPTLAAAHLRAEIERIVRTYQTQQLDRAKLDKLIYNRVSLTAGEVLLAVSDLQIVQNQDTLTVNVSVRNAAGQDVNLVFPLNANS